METDATPPGIYTQALTPLNLTNITHASELSKLIVLPEGPVAAATYFPQKNVLLAVYTQDGTLKTWDVDQAVVVAEHKLGIVGTPGIGFDRTGDLVIGALNAEIMENDFGEWIRVVGGIAIWKTETGELVKCVVSPCDIQPPTIFKPDRYGVALHPEARWVIGYSDLGVSVEDLWNGKTDYAYTPGWDGRMRYIGLIAFDPTSGRYAIACQEGEILVVEVGKEIGWFASTEIRLDAYERNKKHRITGLSFSPNGEWLGRVQDDVLTVWKIRARDGDLYSKFNLAHGQLLAFDQSSELLFIGTDDTTLVWDVIGKEIVGEIATPGITTLSVSADNRLLVWGDKFATVHVWGVR